MQEEQDSFCVSGWRATQGPALLCTNEAGKLETYGCWGLGGTDGVTRHGGGARTTSSPQVQGGGSLGKAQAHHPHPVSPFACPEQPPAPFLLDWPQENISTVRMMLNGR